MSIIRRLVADLRGIPPAARFADETHSRTVAFIDDIHWSSSEPLPPNGPELALRVFRDAGWRVTMSEICGLVYLDHDWQPVADGDGMLKCSRCGHLGLPFPWRA